MTLTNQQAKEMINWMMNFGKLLDWQKKYCDSVLKFIDSNRKITPGQSLNLKAIYEKSSGYSQYEKRQVIK